MSPSRDPFGFSSKTPTVASRGTDPIIVVAQPGQEFRVVIADDSGGGGFQNMGDTGQSSSPKPGGDSGQASSPKPSGDSGQSSSPKPGGDSGQSSSPKSGGDSGAPDPFAFKPFPRGFSPTPITVVAHAGQEIRIVVPGQT